VVAVLLGLAASSAFACADFFGGVAARRAGAWLSVFANQAVGLVPLSVYLVLLTHHGPTGRDVALSVVAGLAAICGLGLLFGGFAVGRMAVVAPISAGIGGLVPIGWGLLQGERPSAVALFGAAVTLSAAVVLARTEAPAADAGAEHPVPTDDAKASLMAIGAGVAFGVILICLSETTEGAGLWPPMIAHLVAVPLLALGLTIAGQSLRPPESARRVMLASGFFDATAVALLVVALRQDLVSLVAPAANLYPAGTVLLAALVLGERLHRVQVAALLAAAAGLVLLAGG
jgi:drug/metabolite transporter (DMT)-like permease